MSDHDLVQAIVSLYPNSAFKLRNNDYKQLDWRDQQVEKPSYDELVRECVRLQQDRERSEYARLRANEYPPVADYLDAVVKGDQVQMQRYVDACLAVKAKYPKPE
jgi:hypothetical protein